MDWDLRMKYLSNFKRKIWGNNFSIFGRDSVVARNYYPGEDLAITDRPKEGDLIYFPLWRKIVQIKRVEVEKPFYQLGKSVFELSCELFKYEDEEISTGSLWDWWDWKKLDI